MSDTKYFDTDLAIAQLDEMAEREEKKKKRKTLFQIIKYALCAASAGVIELVSFTILSEAILPNFIAADRHIVFITDVPLTNFISTLIALTLSILWNFTFNRKFTFKSAGNVARAMFLAFLFYVPFYPFKLWFNGYMPGYLVADAAASAGVTVAAYLEQYAIVVYAVEVCTMLINGVLEFCWQKFVIYRKEEGSAEAEHAVGELGEFGEVSVKREDLSGMDCLNLMEAGYDISAMDEKETKKALKAIESEA